MIVCIENYNINEKPINYRVCERLSCSGVIFIPLPLTPMDFKFTRNKQKALLTHYEKYQDNIITIMDLQEAYDYQKVGINTIVEGYFERGINDLLQEFWEPNEILTIYIAKNQNHVSSNLLCQMIIDASLISTHQITQIISKKIIRSQKNKLKNS